jgi:hypothetical protein
MSCRCPAEAQRVNSYQLHHAFIRLRAQYRKLYRDHVEMLAELAELRREVRATRAEFDRLRQIDSGQRADRDERLPLN